MTTNSHAYEAFRRSMLREGRLIPVGLLPEPERSAQDQRFQVLLALALLARNTSADFPLDGTAVSSRIYDILDEAYHLEMNAIYSLNELISYTLEARDARVNALLSGAGRVDQPPASDGSPAPFVRRPSVADFDLDQVTPDTRIDDSPSLQAWRAVLRSAIALAREATPWRVGLPRRTFEPAVDLNAESPMTRPPAPEPPKKVEVG